MWKAEPQGSSSSSEVHRQKILRSDCTWSHFDNGRSLPTLRYALSSGSSSVAMTRSRSPAIDPGESFAWRQSDITSLMLCRGETTVSCIRWVGGTRQYTAGDALHLCSVAVNTRSCVCKSCSRWYKYSRLAAPSADRTLSGIRLRGVMHPACMPAAKLIVPLDALHTGGYATMHTCRSSPSTSATCLRSRHR